MLWRKERESEGKQTPEREREGQAWKTTVTLHGIDDLLDFVTPYVTQTAWLGTICFEWHKRNQKVKPHITKFNFRVAQLWRTRRARLTWDMKIYSTKTSSICHHIGIVEGNDIDYKMLQALLQFAREYIHRYGYGGGLICILYRKISEILMHPAAFIKIILDHRYACVSSDTSTLSYM